MHPFVFLFLLYFVTALLLCFRFVFDRKSLSIASFRLTLLALVLHSFFLGWHLLEVGFPFLVSTFETFQLASYTLVLAYVILSFSHRFLATGVILMPVSLIFYILSLTHVVEISSPGSFLQNPWALLHLAFSFVGLSVFILSFFSGIFYLLQEGRIKRKKIGGFMDRFPPLETLSIIHMRALWLGFILFSLGLLAGGGWSKSISGHYLANNLKSFLSVGLWIFFAVFLNLRVSHGWVGRKGIVLSSIGFFGIIFLFTWVQR